MKGIQNLIRNNKINMELLLSTDQKPNPQIRNEEPFWDDAYISEQMLSAHLNPDLDAASYKHKTIDQIVDWLVKYHNLKEGARILDLGCGPGLYCTRFAKYGLNVVGMDYSKNSIRYAKKYAQENGLDIHYIYQDYLTMDYDCEFDAVFLIYCDFGALTDEGRDRLLQKIYKALKPGGVFVFDVFTSNNWQQQTKRNWYASEVGFWRPTPHLVLEQTFYYQDEAVYLKQYIVIDESGKVSTYHIRDHYYSKQSIQELMSKHGFQVQDCWSDLTGEDYQDNTKCLGVSTRK